MQIREGVSNTPIFFKMEILSAEVSTFVHVTEDPEKVLRCLDNLMPFEYELVETRTTGQFGNPIKIFSSNIKKKSHIDELIAHLKNEIPERDLESLMENLDERMEKGNMYIRLEKDSLFHGILKLGKGIQLVINCASYPFNRDEIILGLRDRFQGA